MTPGALLPLSMLSALLIGCGAESTRQPEDAAAGAAGAGMSAGRGGTGAGGWSAGGTSAGLPGAAGEGGSIGGDAGTPAGGAGAATGGTAGTVASGSGGLGAGGAAGAGSGGSPVGGDGGVSAAGTSSGGAPSFEVEARLASDIKSTAPTTVGVITWSLEGAVLTEAHIDFGLDTTYGTTAPVDLMQAGYRTLLVGLKPERTYHFRVVAMDGSRTYTSADQTLTTGALPDTVPGVTSSIALPEKVDEGFLIGSFWQFDDSAKVYILDADGDLVWWYTDPTITTTSDGIGRARLSADGRDLWLVNGQRGVPLRRVSMDTLEEQIYPETGGSHDLTTVSGDTMAYLDTRSQRCAIITEVDRSGATRPVFDSSTVLTSCHANAIRYSEAEDVYVFSDRNNDVFGVGRTGDLLWRLSERVSGGHESWGGIQHGVQLLEQSLLVFANEAGGDQMHSQAIEFGLDGSVIKAFSSRSGTAFFGDVQRLPSGNTLIAYSGLIHVVDANDEVVMELAAVNSPFAYVEFRPSLYGPPGRF